VTILAGGIGSRFWPVSTPERPKQLLPLAGPDPLIRETVDRARELVDPERVRILAGEHLAGPFRRVLPGLPQEAYLVEPRARGTCPVLAWAAWTLARRDPDAVLVSLHADHLIRPVEAFVETVRSAATVAARDGLLLTVGVRPDRVETGYGHIQQGEEIDAPGEARAFRVGAFHEKPDRATAQRYTDRGYLWNTGIFVWKASVFLEEVERHAPEVAETMPLLESGGAEAFFDAVPVSVVDRAVMERSDRVACVEATFDWDDVGSWSSLSRTRSGDEAGNVLEGDARVVDGSGNVVWADEGRVVVWGVNGLVVVRTGETTLVMPLERAPDLKTLLARLEEAP
jgi:mannose-1-phosphate guanylyltransferase